MAAVGTDDALGYWVSFAAIARQLHISVEAVTEFCDAIEPNCLVGGLKLVLGSDRKTSTESPATNVTAALESDTVRTITFDILPELNLEKNVEPNNSISDDATTRISDPYVIDSKNAQQIAEPIIEEPPTPTAWQVWMYLERQRTSTLQCIGTFDAEWKAHRFIEEAERKNNNKLRIHYEIHPVIDDLTTPDDVEEIEADIDLIEVEVITETV